MTQLQIEYRPVEALIPYALNPKTHSDAQIAAIGESMREFGWTNPVLINGDGGIIAGHGRIAAAKAQGISDVPCIVLDHLNDAQVRALVTLDNWLTEHGASWNLPLLQGEIAALSDMKFDLERFGMTAPNLTAAFPGLFAAGAGGAQPAERAAPVGNLADRFGLPPFSVLSARDGWWQARKRAWLRLGIRSELGRGVENPDDPQLTYKGQASLNAITGQRKAGLLYGEQSAEFDHYHRREGTRPALAEEGDARQVIGTSIFDPVLCELAYRWFSPPGGKVLDPFAGGSVRGVVAAWLGRQYVGVDLSGRQIAANREQWEAIREGRPTAKPEPIIEDPAALTPIQTVGDVLVKRDDLFEFAGVPGGKVRTCLALARAALAAGQSGLVTAGSRASPQVNIVARVGRALGLPVRCHTPQGKLALEVQAALEARAEVIQHKAGHNTVIVARAREDAAARGWAEIPFGMECLEAITQTRRQVANVPPDVRRIVIPVGSGMSAAGVLWGLIDQGLSMPVIGVVVGADPADRLDHHAPQDWRDRMTLIPSGSDYHEPAAQTAFGHLDLDPHYEAKCIDFLEPGDLLWIVGVRATSRLASRPASTSVVAPSAGPALRWRVGAKTMTARHDCTLSGIQARCGGGCCRAGPSRSYWPARAYGDVCGNLGPSGCTLSPDDKPVTCLLYPLVAHDDKGSIVLHHRTRLPTSVCRGNYGQGPMLIDAIADNLRTLFGDAEFERVHAEVTAGRDSYFDVPPDIAEAVRREHGWADRSLKPVPRSQAGTIPESTPPARPDPVWIEGDSRAIADLLPADFEADFIWTCPPYADLEVYSDHPADLSAMSDPDFTDAYRQIIAAACARLKPDRFAAITVGEVRDDRGMCRNLPGLTIEAFEAAGLKLYNDAILVTAVGSLPIRVGRQFTAARKLGRTHQSVLVFVKGDPKAATAACGAVEFGDAPDSKSAGA